MHTIDKVLYAGHTHTLSGRDGSARSDDGRLDIKLSRPGSSGAGTNPEQLADEFFLQARLLVHLPGVDRITAQAIADAAHRICPYSKATRGNLGVTIAVA